jgi:hypothetical protein
MTLNLYATQQDIFAFVDAEYATYDTNFPETADEPNTNGYLEPYVVLRFNDAVKVPQRGGSVGGARHDEMYTLIDALCVAADPDEARKLAYGPEGVADYLTGFVPVDGGELTRESGGQVFVRADGTNTLPRRFIAVVSFRCAVNTTIDE